MELVDKPPTPKRPVLDRKTEEMLADFCEAYHDANPTAVVNKAVRHFILADVAKNPGARDVYEALQREREKKADRA